MRSGYESQIDRKTLNYLASRAYEKWFGFVITTRNSEDQKNIQKELDEILEEGNYASSQNGTNLSAITDAPTSSIVYFAGPYSKETMRLIKDCLNHNKISFKRISGGHERFAAPYWVKETLGLPPKRLLQ